MQKTIAIALIVFMLFNFTACGEEAPSKAKCAHEWQEATCNDPKTCLLCGEIEGYILDHNYEHGVCAYCGDSNPEKALMTVNEYDMWFKATNPARVSALKTVVDDGKEFVATDTGFAGEGEYNVVYLTTETTVFYSDADYQIQYTPSSRGIAFMTVKAKEKGNGDLLSTLKEAVAPLNGYGYSQGLSSEGIEEIFDKEATSYNTGKALSKEIADVTCTVTAYYTGSVIATLILEE